MLQIHLVFETCVGFKGYMVFPVAKDHIYCSLRNHSDTSSITQEIQLCKDRQKKIVHQKPLFLCFTLKKRNWLFFLIFSKKKRIFFLKKKIKCFFFIKKKKVFFSF